MANEESSLYRSALETVLEPLLLWAPDGTIAFASRSFLERFGLDQHEVEGGSERELQAALNRRGLSLSPAGISSGTPEGASFERRAHPLEAGARLETFRDVSGARQEAERREEILGVASHDLRSPLANVRSYAGLLMGGRLGGLEPRVKRSAEVIARNADRALRLLQSWFDVQRAETGELDVHRQQQPLLDLINEALAARQAAANEKGIALVANLPPNLPTVDVDHERFENALGALIENAIARSEPSGRVELSYEEREGQLWICLSDSGPKLSAEEATEAFDRDTQVLREKHLGVGFSLAVARAVMLAHGGRAGVEARGDRTVFFLNLPRPQNA
jgi:signal transduction histidine kinase